MKRFFGFICSLCFLSCNGQSDYPYSSEPQVFEFKSPQDSARVRFSPPADMTVGSYTIHYRARWNDSLIDRGVVLPASDYNTNSTDEFFGTGFEFWYKKYKATDYYVKITVVFHGLKKK